MNPNLSEYLCERLYEQTSEQMSDNFSAISFDSLTPTYEFFTPAMLDLEEGHILDNEVISLNFPEKTLSRTRTSESLASVLARRAMELRNENTRDACAQFFGNEHRLVSLGECDGVEYINDARATSVNSAWFALSSMQRPTVWIVGGDAPHCSAQEYSMLDEAVRDSVQCIVAFGESARSIFHHFSAFTRCVVAHSMYEAVRLAEEFSAPGSAVLFAPAHSAPSDTYANTAGMSEDFTAEVLALRYLSQSRRNAA